MSIRVGSQQKICNSTGSNEGVREAIALKVSDDKHENKMTPTHFLLKETTDIGGVSGA